MLKKNDLAKQFELVVQQEIKNYQDSLNFVLQSLKSINESIEAVKNQILDTHAQLHNQLKLFEIRIENLEKSHSDHKKAAENSIFDLKTSNSKNSDQLLCLKNQQDESLRYQDKLFERTDNLKFLLKEMDQSHNKKRSDLDSKIEFYNSKMIDHVQKTKQEILELPSDSLKIKEELEEKMNIDRVDVKGLLKEIRVNRVNTDYIEKKIENIYTLIERLQKSAVIS